MSRPDRLLAAYDAQRDAVVGWLAALDEREWERPSVLAGWTVRELAFHLTEVPAAVTTALGRGPTKEKPLSVGAYTSAWAAASGEIAARDRDSASGLTKHRILERHDAAHAEFHSAIDSVTRKDMVITARRGPIKLSDFLVTRVNELVVHSRDLSASVPEVEPVTLVRDAVRMSTGLLLVLLAERAPGKSVEVRVPPYGAVQCIEGPRHTRGTPGSVVEIEPVAWVELACGRIAWADAVAKGRVHASGERSDLTPYLPVLS